MRIVSLIVMVMHSAVVFAQFGPFTNNTVNAVSAEALAKNKLEIQLTPIVANSERYFDADGNKQKYTSERHYESSMYIQMSMGFTDKLEVGASLPFDATSLSVGAKYSIMEIGTKWKLAAAGWTSVPTTTRVKNTSEPKTTSDLVTGAVGAAIQYAVTNKMNVYFDVFGQNYFGDAVEEPLGDIMIDLDVDYSLTDRLSAIAGYTYQQSNFEESNQNSNRSTMSVAVLYVPVDSWNIYFAQQFDVAGKNNAAYTTSMLNLAIYF